MPLPYELEAVAEWAAQKQEEGVRYGA